MTPFGRAALFVIGSERLTRRQSAAVLAVALAGDGGLELDELGETLELGSGALEYVLGGLGLRGIVELVDERVVLGRRIRGELVA